MKWVFLTVVIIAETIATSALKYTDGFVNMNMDIEEVKYNYLFRPGYHSKEWLIEVRNGEEFDLRVFIDAIKDISPKIIKATHDEFIRFLKTDEQTIRIETIIGKLIINWHWSDFVFIIASENVTPNKFGS